MISIIRFFFKGVFITGLIGFLAVLFVQSYLNPEPQSTTPTLLSHENLTPIIQQVDLEYQQTWEKHKLHPTPKIDDLSWMRRVGLSLTGTIPSIEEIRVFESKDPELRRDWWLQHLFNDQRYADYMAERFARLTVGTVDGAFLIYRRRKYVEWLSDHFKQNTPYDQIIRKLITAEGLWTQNPEANFLISSIEPDTKKDGPNEIALAARISRAFLATPLDCVQCHDDHLGGPWKQKDFHRLASYFAGTKTHLGGLQQSHEPYTYKFSKKREAEVVQPEVPFSKNLPTSHSPDRAQLAQWITHSKNKAFSRAIVNRAWALIFGRPLIDPVDRIPLEGPYPPGLELLAEDFSQNGYNLRRLTQVITSLHCFNIDSKQTLNRENTLQHDQHWASFPLSRLRPEQIARSLLQASSLRTLDAESHILIRLYRHDLENKFVKRYGDQGENELLDLGGTIPQRLQMMNGSLVNHKKNNPLGNLQMDILKSINEHCLDSESAIETLYLCSLTRRPNTNEKKYFTKILKETPHPGSHQRLKTINDFSWSLLNSTEFSWNH